MVNMMSLGLSCCSLKWVGCGVLVCAVPLLLIPIVVSLLRLVLLGKIDTLSASTQHKKGRHVLVTGGSSGIGLEVAKLYAKLGDKVTIVARNMQKLEEAKQLIVKETGCKSDSIQSISCDVGDGMEKVEEAFAKAKDEFGSVDILINSAGITYINSFDTSDINEYEKIMRVNYLGSVYATRAVIADMKHNKRGNIVFVASQVAQVGHSSYKLLKAFAFFCALVEASIRCCCFFCVQISLCFVANSILTLVLINIGIDSWIHCLRRQQVGAERLRRGSANGSASFPHFNFGLVSARHRHAHVPRGDENEARDH